MTTDTSGLKPIPRLSGGLPLLGNILELQSDRYGTLFRVQRECGGIGMLRAGPKDMLILSDHNLIQELLVEHGDKIHRGPFYNTFTPILGRYSLLTNSGEPHRRQRKLHVPAFGNRRMVQYANTMMECIRPVVDSLKDGERVDMDVVMGRLARLIIAKTFFSLDEGPAAEHFQHCITVIEKHLAKMTTVPIPLWVPTPSNRNALKTIGMLRDRAQEIIDDHQARTNGQDIGDLLSMLRDTRNEDDGSKLSPEEMIDHVVTMYIAGQETTAVGLVWICVHLAQNPELQRKLQEEVDTQLQGRPPTSEDLVRLPYNLKFIKETLRRTNPAPLFGRESLREFRLGDYLVPAKQFIFVSTLTMHHAPDVFPDPERFDPERFSPEMEKSRSRFSFLPFATGAHTCIGNYFAMLELQLTLAYMMQHVSVELAPGPEIEPKLFVTMKPSSSQFIVKSRAAAQPHRAATA